MEKFNYKFTTKKNHSKDKEKWNDGILEKWGQYRHSPQRKNSIYFFASLRLCEKIFGKQWGQPGNIPSFHPSNIPFFHESKIQLLALILLCLAWMNTQAQFNNFGNITGYNYIYSKATLDQSFTATDEYIEQLQYFDGLGRPSQVVDYGASPTGRDIVQPITYDQYGREVIKYLPYVDAYKTGKYKTNWVSEQEYFYTVTMAFGEYDGPYAYSKTVFENSPLNRVLKQGSPGEYWQPDYSYDAVFKYQYGTNTAGTVAYWNVSGSLPGVVTFTYAGTYAGTYAANTLYKTTVLDEVNYPTTEYKDKQGNVVLKVNAEGGKTYYIYDDYGLLRCVVPPLATVSASPATFNSTQAEFNELCYYYEYDQRFRMIKKKLPGTVGCYEMTYDGLDRLTSTKDPNGNYVYNDYDDFSRVTKTRSSTNANDWLTKNTYDVYGTYAATYPFNGAYHTKTDNVKGKLTESVEKVLNPETGIQTEVATVFYYDTYGQLIETIRKDHLGGKEEKSIKYSYTNSERIERTKLIHTLNGSSKTVYEIFSYDHAGRLLTVDHQIGTATATRMSESAYYENGSLKYKKVGGNLQQVDYLYNIRGMLTDINNVDDNTATDLFKMRLGYFSDVYENGNIVTMDWSSVAGVKNSYLFVYDALNRLSQAYLGLYDSYYTYDANGNLKTLKRYSATYDGSPYCHLIDDLTYKYYNNNKSNRLSGVGDAASDVWGRGDFNEAMAPGLNDNEYYYDNNGNMTDGFNTYMWIQYNYLNLPFLIDQGDGNPIFKTSYSANGMKLRQIKGIDVTTSNDYIGPMVYKDGVLDYIITSEGRAVYNGGSFNHYEYHLKDHLGNIRIAFKNNGGTPLVTQRNDYYPFGLLMRQSGASTNKYLFNGKEQMKYTDSGYGVDMNWEDYGARMYDASLGRWHVIDPMVENQHHDYSPYAYVYNNPIRFYDVMGLDSGDVYVFDWEERPVDNGTQGQTYSGSAIVETDDGEYSDSYRASTHPNSKSNSDNSTKYNTLEEGEHSYNNESGHKGGTRKGLNIDDSDNGSRTTTGKDPDGNEVEMTYVNVHSGASDNGNSSSRGSKGCVTVHPDDMSGFNSNFDWSGSNGNTGNSSGSIFIIRLPKPQVPSPTSTQDNTKLVTPIKIN